MKDERFASPKKSVSYKLLILGLVASVLYWIVESVADTMVHEETFTQRLWPSDPNELWMRFTTVALILIFGGYAQFLVSRRERVEESLRESEDRLRALSGASFEAVAITENGKILEINDTFTKIFGYEPEEVLGAQAVEFVTEESRELVRRNIATGSEEPYEATGLRKDGTRFEAEIRAKMSEYQGRRVRVAAIRDVTKRKRAEQELRKSEERYRQVFERNRAVKLLIDPESGAILDANVAACEYYGYSLEELKAGNIADINTLSPEQVAEEIARARSEERGYFVFRHRLATGEVRDVEVHSSPIEIAEQSVLYSIVHDITARKQTERQLRESEERYRLVTRATREAIWDNNLLTGEQQWDGAAEAMLGYDFEGGTQGTWWEDRIHPDDRERVISGIESVLREGGEVWSDEYRFRHAEGNYLTVVDRGYVVHDEAGRSVRIIGSMLDITARKQAERELRQAKEVADAANQAKSEFLANMSHEIRTPMNGVIGMTGLLLDTELTEEQRAYAQTARNSGDVLLALLDDILDFSKIEAGEVHLESIDFDLQEVLKDAAAVFGERAREKGLELVSFVEYDAPVALRGDPFRIRQVLTNLLSNAVKFTQKGRIVLRAQGLKTEGVEAGGVSEEASATIRFEVTDTGIGMSEEQQVRLFEPFVQADTSTTRRYGGTGLGLAICKQLVELMGGEIHLKSEPGMGSAFSFTLPLTKQPHREHPHRQREHPDRELSDREHPEKKTLRAPSTASTSAEGGEHQEEEKEAASGESSGTHVLVVEDTLTNQMVAVELLKRRGYEVDVVSNGVQAVEAATRRPYAAILMDIQMPEMDGYEATGEIRRHEGDEQHTSPGHPPRHTPRHTPIIAMTAHALQGDREKALSAGMDDYLSKPVRPEQLDRVLKRWIPQSPSQAAPQATPQAAPQTASRETRAQDSPSETNNANTSASSVPAPASVPDSSLDQSVLADLRLIQREGGADIVERLVEAFLSETPLHLAALRATLRNDLREAAGHNEQEEAQSFRRTAHALNGVCRGVGARGMAEICLDLERLGDFGYLTEAPRLLERLEQEFERVKVLLDAELSRG